MTQKTFLFFLSLFLLLLSGMTLSAKEQAALTPMGALGAFSDIEKAILFSTLQENLSIHYILISQQNFEKAQEQAFDELEAEECTEDQCFAKIQELLQVENLFLFQMNREQSFTQLKLTRINIDGERTVRNALCNACDIETLIQK